MKKLFLFLIGSMLLLTATAQNESKSKKEKRREERRQRINEIARQEEEGVIKYKKHFVFGGKLTNDGYGGFLEMARAQSVKKSLLFQFEITERKHQKEEKIQAISDFNTTPFIFGKINFFYPVKIGVQQQFLLGNKGNKNGVSVTANVGGGLSIAMLRPYQIQINDGSGTLKYISYEADSAAYVNAYLNNDIVSGPSFGKGWGGVKFTPGIYLKPAVRFDYGQYNEMVNAIEVGLTAEFYSKKVNLMLDQKQKQFYFSAYVAIVLGRRK
ncbi:MAG: hypothetical protein WAT19_10255 [Ferruginibacter sp.]